MDVDKQVRLNSFKCHSPHLAANKCLIKLQPDGVATCANNIYAFSYFI